MGHLSIEGRDETCEIFLNRPLREISGLVNGRQAVIITDENVQSLHGARFPDWPVIVTRSGEDHKTIDALNAIYARLIELEVDRSFFIIGIGGGIVCDMAGFAASTYMRGLPFGFVPTTLLAQADASIGGKNGVNFSGYKNMVGLFNQPRFVLHDFETLHTLPPAELACGFAEIIKHAAIADAGYFEYLLEHCSDLLALDSEALEHVVRRSIEIKSAIVEADEREQGLRRKLNFGHTFAHAFEKTTELTHGQAVAVGMLWAGGLSVKRHMLGKDALQALSALIDAFRLPLQVDTDKASIVSAMRKDKKRDGESIHFVLLKDIGQAEIVEIPSSELEAIVDDLC